MLPPSSINPIVNSPAQTTIWQKTTGFASKGAKSLGLFTVKEAGLMGVSALCGYLGTKIFGEIPLNVATKGLNMVGLVDREGWTYLNARGMAVFAAASVPIFQVANKIFGNAILPDGSQKSVVFSMNDAGEMAKAGFMTYFSVKCMETLANSATKLTDIYQKGNADNPRLANGIGLASLLLIGKGISDLSATIEITNETEEASSPKKTKTVKVLIGSEEIEINPQNKTVTPHKTRGMIELLLGSVGAAYTAIRTGVNYYSIPAPAPLSTFQNLSSTFWSYLGYKTPEVQNWSWSYIGAQGMASRAAIGIPMQILLKQVFGQVMYNKDMPEVVRKGAEIAATTANIIISSAIADSLGLPGSSLSDPYETLKSMVLWMGGMYLLEKGVTQLVDMAFPDDPVEANPENLASKQIKELSIKPKTPKKFSPLTNKTNHAFSMS